MSSKTLLKFYYYIIQGLIVSITTWGFIVPKAVSAKSDVLVLLGCLAAIFYPIYVYYISKTILGVYKTWREEKEKQKNEEDS